MNPRYRVVARRAGYRCEYCRAPEVAFNFVFEVEHIFPVAEGGTDDLFNLALACRGCNLRKRNRILDMDELSGGMVSLFHPRHDRWSEHFKFDLDEFLLIGLTPAARATIRLLDLNHPKQLVARRLWVKARLFP